MFYIFLSIYEALVNLSVDMVLPAFYFIAQSFHVEMEKTRYMISMWFFGSFAFNGLMEYLANIFGRKKLLIVSTIVFVFANVLCATATTFYFICALRILQGMSFGAIYVAGYAIFHDMYSGSSAVKALSMTQIIAMIAPVTGPSIGLVIAQNFGWRAIFIFLSIVSIINVFSIIKWTPDDVSKPENMGEKFNFHKWLSSYTSLLSNVIFLKYLAIHCLRFGMTVIWTANAAVVLRANNFSERTFVIVQTVSFVSFIIGLFASGRLITKIAVNSLITSGLCITFIGAVMLYLTGTLSHFNVILVAGSVCVLSCGTGLFTSPIARLAVESSNASMSVVTTVMSTLYAIVAFVIIMFSQLFLSVSSVKDISIVMCIVSVILIVMYKSLKEKPVFVS